MVNQKRIFCVFLALIAALSLWAPASANAQTQLSIEQCCIVLPRVDVYFYPLETQDAPSDGFQPELADISGVLGSRALTAQSIAPYAGGTTYYFLLDISGSISKSVFSAIQSGLCDWIDRLGTEDKLVLFTFGEAVTRELSGNESAEDAKAVITGLKADDSQTNFYNAMNTVLDLARNDAGGRHIAIVLTDGKDVSDGGSATRDELLAALANAELPLYALGIGSNKGNLDALGELARAASGRYLAIDAKSGAETMAELESWLGSCWLASFAAESNIAGETRQQLIFKVREGEDVLSASVNVEVKDWTPDTDAPYIVDVQPAGERSMSITFSEAVSGADAAQNFSIWRVKEKTSSDGAIEEIPITPLEITDIVYDGRACTATLTFADKLYAGNYSISASNVSDISVERNELTDALGGSVYIDGPKLPFFQKLKENTPLLIGCIAAAALIIALSLFLIIRKRRLKKAAPDHVLSGGNAQNGKIIIADTACIRTDIHIVEANGVSRDLCVSVGASYVVGRSRESCDLVIMDKYISRRHFELYYNDDHLFIKDLGSRSSTIVNGIPIQAPRPICSGDVVVAGETRFVFRMA